MSWLDFDEESGMRIERIRSVGDGGIWVIDQLLHGLIVFAAFAPAALWAGLDSTSAQSVGGVMILTVREFEQWRGKSPGAKAKQALAPWYIRHLDRSIDVLMGTLIGVVALRLVF